MVQNRNYLLTNLNISSTSPSLESVFALYNNWVFYIFRCSSSVCIYIYNCYFSLVSWPLCLYVFPYLLWQSLTSILCDKITVIFVPFCHHLHGIPFSISFTFSLYMIFNLKWVSYRKHIVDLVFELLFSADQLLCVFLLGEFNSFTFKVIINRKDLLLLYC